MQAHKGFDIELPGVSRRSKKRCSERRACNSQPYRFECSDCISRTCVYFGEIAAVSVHTRQFGQGFRFTPLIVNGTTELQGFAQFSQGSFTVSGFTVKASNVPLSAREHVTVSGDSVNRKRTFKVIASLFRFAELRVDVAKIVERVSLAIGIPHRTPERKGFVV